MTIPQVSPRRPLYDDEPNGYLESDNDFVANNIEACVWFLTNRDKLQELLTTSHEESGRDQRNAAKSQGESVKLLNSNREFIMRHIGCMVLLNTCRRQLTDQSELKDQIDHALTDGATLHPTMDIRQMRSGDWWIEPRR